MFNLIEFTINDRIGGREEYLDWFNNDSPYDKKIHKLYKIGEEFLPSVPNFVDVSHGKRVILSNRIFVLSKAIENVFPVPFKVFTSPLEMISERGFPLLKRFSQLIMYMKDGGIMQKLIDDIYFNMTILHHIRNRDLDEEESQIILTVSHLDGAFTLLIVGEFISLMVFIGEIIINTYQRRRRARRLWNLVRNSWRQVSIMRTVKRNKNTTKLNSKWNNVPRKKRGRKVKFNISNDANHRNGKNAIEWKPKLTHKTVV